MDKLIKLLNFLDKHEIPYRLESNHCLGYIFYFLDGSVYPRRFHDARLDPSIKQMNKFQSLDNLVEQTVKTELIKDWKHRIECEKLIDLFGEVEKYLKK